MSLKDLGTCFLGGGDDVLIYGMFLFFSGICGASK